MRHKNPLGYTLIEMLLVLALIAAILGISIPIYQSFQVKNDLDLAVDNIVQATRRAQLLSQANDNNSGWGIEIETGKVIVFKGSTFYDRDVTFDQVYAISANLVPSGNTVFNFTSSTGEIATNVLLYLNTSNGDQRQIKINTKGLIEY